ncbi:MAG: geranylgeranylglycerol-phosphate geranylgeranyltransferase [Bacteroidota bacterium]|nr:geranylgeranylglycerol-phosphate geranylgeranyltransferase [Bacteroidota bacterium]
MKKISAYFNLLRIPNLLMIILTQYLVRYCIILPFYKYYGVESTLGNFNFFLIVFSTILIAGGGYAINDYFDVRIDRINKPDRIILGNLLPRRNAIIIHIILSIIGVLINFYLAYKLKSFKLALINPVVGGLLWFYSTYYKRTFLLGNFIIALLSGFTVITVGIYEFVAISHSAYKIPLDFVYVILVYALFAFVVSLIREMIKDIEDIEGDEKCFCKTIPIVLGIKYSKIIIGSIILISILGIAYFQSIIEKDFFKFWYILITIQIPLIILTYLIINAKHKIDYRFASKFTKFIMLMGVLSMALFLKN